MFICYLLYKLSEMRRFLVDRTSIENVNDVQREAEVEEPPPNVANEFNPFLFVKMFKVWL